MRKTITTPHDTTLDIAQSTLLTPGHLALDQIQALATQLASGRGIDDTDLYFQYARHEGWSLEEGIVRSGSFGIEQGVGIRLVSGDKTAFAYSDDISLASINASIETVKAMSRQGQNKQHRVAAVSRTRSKKTDGQIVPHQLYSSGDPITSLSDAHKVSLLEKVEHCARAISSEVTQVMASINMTHDTVLIARADGRMVADIRPLIRLNVTVIVERNQKREQGFSGGGGRFDNIDQIFNDEFIHRHADRAVKQALHNLEAVPTPAGELTVVLGSGWPAILLHEAIGHGLEGDFNRKGSSAFSGKIGQQVAAKGVTVVDDGTLENRRGSLNVDDEGNPTQNTLLIENGILKGYLQDQMNARLMKTNITGNGRRESYASLPIPRMTNTYMLNGQHPPEEIIRSVKKGIYAVNFQGGQVDITSGKFVFSMSEAYLIENGKPTKPIRGATLIGNGPDVLTRVSMIGNDMQLDDGVGTCGKDGQEVPVGVGQPTLRIDGLTVGGTAC